MANNNGWRALIYDAEWARFKKGQEGVIVSEDGRMCETIGDNRDNILIEADPNFKFAPRSSGHILFIQKGTDLFDIVCLEQESGGKLELVVDSVSMSVCDEPALSYYNDLINILNEQSLVTIKENQDPPYSVTYGDELGQFKIVSPTRNEFTDILNSLDNGGVAEIPLIVSVKKYGDTYVSENGATLTLTRGDGETIRGKRSEFDFSFLTVTMVEESNDSSTEAEVTSPITCSLSPDNAVSETCEGGTVTFTPSYSESDCNCSLTRSPDKLKCNGGTVTFVVTCQKPQEKTYYYSINFAVVKVTTKYTRETCIETQEIEEDGMMVDVSLVPQEGVSVKSFSDGILQLYIDMDVEEFNIKVTSDLGYSCIARFLKINNEFTILNNTCTSSQP